MKRIISVTMLFVFLMSNIGLAATLHYCGGNLCSIDFFSSFKNPCRCEKMNMIRDCCKDKTTYLKVKSDLATTNSYMIKIASQKALQNNVPASGEASFTRVQFTTADFYHPPPFKPKAPVYLLDCAFLIWYAKNYCRHFWTALGFYALWHSMHVAV